MKDLLKFLITNITGVAEFEIEESENDSMIDFNVHAPKESMGLIIGKEGKTIKNIRKIMSIRATIEKKAIQINILEK